MKTLRNLSIFGAILLLLGSCAPKGETATIELKSPIIPGYFADPSVVQYEGKFYMYATADPWGTDFLSCWVSEDFVNWEFNTLNWPTKDACSSELSSDSMVWAPSVIQKGDAFYMYVSVGSEVWCGKASHPLGPWESMTGDKPMISYDPTRYYHVIDAEAFIDDDGQAYLYWGSGWDWKNGHCMAAKLDDDMKSFATEPVEVTPTRYFEAPLMVKHDGKYYLTYSEGITMDETYEVRYAVGDNPFGPFTEAENSPILKYDDSLQVYGPGHHTVVPYNGELYILYHRHRLPFVAGTAYRQTCIGKLTFDDEKSRIDNITPYHSIEFPLIKEDERVFIEPSGLTVSSESAAYAAADCVLDSDYTTRWEAAEDDSEPTLTFIFDKMKDSAQIEIRPEYPWKKYFMKVETSEYGNEWKTAADYSAEGISGSPVIVPANEPFSMVRIIFTADTEDARPSVWEVLFY